MQRVSISLLAIAALCSASLAQKSPRVDVCPWCKNDPAVMSAAGVVSHGPIAIGPKGSEALAAALPAGSWIFLETAHLRWAFALGPETVVIDEKKRVRSELARLKKVLPSVPTDSAKLDPWLRLHLLAMRGEELYARFQQLLQVKDADFPESRSNTGPFMGNGRFLGEKEKFEIVVHPSREMHRTFTVDFSGVSVTDSFRWHFKDQHKLLVSIPGEDGDLRHDRWLFPHVAHNLSHAFFCAYKHFSYDPPVWLDEGLAHVIEKEIDPASVTTDGTEGATRETHSPPDWTDAARKLVARGKAKSLAELMHAKEFGELDVDAHVTAWSMIRFLIAEHPDQLAKILGGVKGQLDANGIPTGKDLPDLERKLLKETGGWTPQSFDEEWRKWAGQQ
ncbi:MAG TPA: hypothetical protein VGR31_09720 [Planctomycetota bacterium]|jgi:hypothetical protein|nr:hypothetical protein [Planctomycetota bacterium]